MLASLGRRVAARLVARTPLAEACSSSGRGVSTSQPTSDLRDFIDMSEDKDEATFGRAWKAAELRLKSWDDLHKLWYVCLKERNMLLTQMQWLRGEPQRDDYKDRYLEVKLTMNRIKQVLSQRAHAEANPIKSAEMKKLIHLM